MFLNIYLDGLMLSVFLMPNSFDILSKILSGLIVVIILAIIVQA